jgi:hypothetical protein
VALRLSQEADVRAAAAGIDPRAHHKGPHAGRRHL